MLIVTFIAPCKNGNHRPYNKMVKSCCPYSADHGAVAKVAYAFNKSNRKVFDEWYSVVKEHTFTVKMINR